MKKIFIIGAGQLGSRHLQALKSIEDSLDIYVIDPSKKSLEIAKERYDSITIIDNNIVTYVESIRNININSKLDIVIIATSSNVRASVTEDLLNNFKVNSIIFEKILFNRKEDYITINDLLKKQNIKAYVNCPMRMMDFYKDIKTSINGSKFKYIVSGSQYGLVTNLIHYLDHMSYLNNSSDYDTDTQFLDNELISSKRDGFYELNGFFQVNFKNGTQGFFNCESKGNSPIIVQGFNDNLHFISKESEGKVLISKSENDWKWEEIKFEIPFQSQLTTILVQDLLKKDSCSLPLYEESMKIHLTYLDSLLEFINTHTENKFNYYPFT
ncbi:Gfo/Idh/MocA family oxidoreductase [Flavobacterium sp.]|jgi:predicted dehydrogenase|uniref:Gfo/Idh/MocA family oxidoreductase n=1 Tax=Flavobacterium sp. TaxID=239 RepID=UPI0037BF10A2